MVTRKQNLSKQDVEALRLCIEDGIIDLKEAEQQASEMQRKEILKKHTSPIWYSEKENRWKTYLPAHGRWPRKQIKKTKRKDLEDEIVNFWRGLETSPTIAEVFTEWNEQQKSCGNIKRATHDRNREAFEENLSDVQDKKASELSALDWADILSGKLAGQKMTSKAFTNLRAVLRGTLKHAHKLGLIQYTLDDVMDEMEISRRAFKPSRKADQDDVFTEDEFNKLKSYLEDPENQTIQSMAVLVICITGMRIGEVVALKWDDIDGNIINVRRTETRYRDDDGNYRYEVDDSGPKTEAGIREVPLPPGYEWVPGRIRELNPDVPYLFMKNGQRITTQAVRCALRRICVNAIHIPPKSPHKLRKSYASFLLDSGAPEYFVKEVLGHTDIETTERFYHRKTKTDFSPISRVPQLKCTAGTNWNQPEYQE